jgi:hypothetical protein
MIVVKIDGVQFNNVGSLTPSVEYDYYYQVKTMDGKIHQKLKGKRTNYSATFYNNNFEKYDLLKKLLFSKQNVILEVPIGSNEWKSAEYLAEIDGDNLKGKLWDENYYFSGLSVKFSKVGYDEE